MNKTPFLTYLQSHKPMIADGATGSNLFQRGLPRGTASENWVLENPEAIIGLHQDFIKAGAQIILTCTFGANPYRLAEAGLDGQVTQVNRRAVELGFTAIGASHVYLAGSIGPLGKLLKPYGPLSPADAEQAYRQQIEVLADAGVDLLVIETQFDHTEATSAVKATRSITDLPLVVSYSYDRGTKTMMGVSPTQMVNNYTNLDVDLIGINCGRSIEDNLKVLQEVHSLASKPIWFKPNAGIPVVDENGETSYPMEPQVMGKEAEKWLAEGASVIGGCCGTTPSHLKAIAQAVKVQN